MDEELREILNKWIEATRLAGEKQIEASRLVCEIFEHLQAKELKEKFQEANREHQFSLN